MKAIIRPSIANGTVHIPPSKSMAHRAIICASLASGKSIIHNIDYSDDIQTTIDCMRKLGATITCFDHHVEIEGIADFNSLLDPHIECNESGSTLRFLIPIFSLTHQKIRFTGKNRLLKRPLQIYKDIFHHQHLSFTQTKDFIEIQGSIQSDDYTIPGDVSSQFISGLLLSLPLLEKDSTIHILPPFESKSYIDLTIQAMKQFQVEIKWMDEHTLHIKGNQKYQACHYEVEGDFSQFAFFAVLGAINHGLRITGMNSSSLQGDRQILDILNDFQVNFTYEDGIYSIKKSKTMAHDIDLSNCPDLGPILCILAMFSQGTSCIYNASRLRLKESDRIAAMVSECFKMGCIIETVNDEMFVYGGDFKRNVVLDGWKDHRIVMACSIALTLLGGEINGCEAISKSYPAFFEDLKALGIEVEINEEA